MAFEIIGCDVLTMSRRAAIGLAHQDQMPVWGQAESLVDLKGTDLIGLPLRALTRSMKECIPCR